MSKSCPFHPIAYLLRYIKALLNEFAINRDYRNVLLVRGG